MKNTGTNIQRNTYISLLTGRDLYGFLRLTKNDTDDISKCILLADLGIGDYMSADMGVLL